MECYENQRKTTLMLKERFERGLRAREKKAETAERANGGLLPETIADWRLLARVYKFMSDRDRAIKTLERVLGLSLDNLGLEHSATFALWRDLRQYYYDNDEEPGREIETRRMIYARAVKEYGEHDVKTCEHQLEIAISLWRIKDFDEARKVAEMVLQSLCTADVQDQTLVARTKRIIAETYHSMGLAAEKKDLHHYFERAASLLEEVLRCPKASLRVGEAFYWMCIRTLRNCYIDLHAWDKAIERGREAVDKSISLNGKYSKETLKDLEFLDFVYRKSNRFPEIFKLGLDICDSIIHVHGAATSKSALVVLHQYQKLQNIQPTEEEFLQVFALLWSVYETFEHNFEGEDDELKSDLVTKMTDMETAAQPSWKNGIEHIKKKPMNIIDESGSSPRSNSLLAVDNVDRISSPTPEENSDERAKNKRGEHEFDDRNAANCGSDESAEESEDLPNDKCIGVIEIGLDGGACYRSNRNRESHGADEQNIHGTCNRLLDADTDPGRVSLLTDKHDQSAFSDNIAKLEAAVKAGNAQLVSDDMSDEQLLCIAEELDCRRGEEMFIEDYEGVCLNSFADWPIHRWDVRREQNRQ